MASGRLEGCQAIVTDSEAFMGPAVSDAFRLEGATVTNAPGIVSSRREADELLVTNPVVDILVINLASTLASSPVDEIDDDDLERALNSLVRPTLWLMEAAIPPMVERGSGKIVVMGSAAAIRAVPELAIYSAARSAQLALVRSVGVEVAKHNVQVNAIAQSFVESPNYFGPEVQATAEFQRQLEDVPAKRVATAAEAARLAVYLASTDSDFMAGQVVAFAGGWA